MTLMMALTSRIASSGRIVDSLSERGGGGLTLVSTHIFKSKVGSYSTEHFFRFPSIRTSSGALDIVSQHQMYSNVSLADMLCSDGLSDLGYLPPALLQKRSANRVQFLH